MRLKETKRGQGTKEVMHQAKEVQFGSLGIKGEGCKQEKLDWICILERTFFGSLEETLQRIEIKKQEDQLGGYYRISGKKQ